MPSPAGQPSHTEVLVGHSVPETPAVTLAQADDDGPAVDAVAVPAGRSVFVRSVGLTGTGLSTGSLFLVTDSGVMYGVRDEDTAAASGLTDPASLHRGRCSHAARGAGTQQRDASVAQGRDRRVAVAGPWPSRSR